MADDKPTLEPVDDKAEVEDTDFTSDSVLKKRVLRKIDLRLLPILGALYCISLIDRTNISVARISGLDDDLSLDVGNRSSVALLVSSSAMLYQHVILTWGRYSSWDMSCSKSRPIS
jgi:hypothetical protein